MTLFAVSVGVMSVASQLAERMFPFFLPALALGLASVACGIEAVAVLFHKERIVAIVACLAAVIGFLGYVVLNVVFLGTMDG